ncbi:MAG: four helix bundle protein [Mariniphaga sp.]|nr:four helix bundle protein [Mariniphaga sp.]
MKLIKTHKELDVYNNAFQAALEIYALTKTYPKEEKYSLTDQIRRSSRSVCANIAEAFRKRRYEKAFVAKLSDVETEAAETQVWLDFSIAHKYIDEEKHEILFNKYDHILAQIITMINQPKKWSN